MNLFYEEYPETVRVEGREVPIVTDFREYVKLMDMLKSEDLEPYEKMCFLGQYFKVPPGNFEKALDALSGFIAMEGLGRAGTKPPAESGPAEDGSQEEDPDGEEPQKDVYSFEIDYPFIFSAFLQDYGINIRTIPYMHWWEFRMLFSGLSESTEIKQRMMYRSIDLSKVRDKEERRRIEKIQRSIRLPGQALTDYDIGNAFM